MLLYLPQFNSMTTAELRITIEHEDILERDEDFTIMLDTREYRVNIANSTSVVILNDDGELVLRNTSMSFIALVQTG